MPTKPKIAVDANDMLGHVTRRGKITPYRMAISRRLLERVLRSSKFGRAGRSRQPLNSLALQRPREVRLLSLTQIRLFHSLVIPSNSREVHAQSHGCWPSSIEDMRQTVDSHKSGYIPRDKLEEFLQNMFPSQEAFAIKVKAALL